MAMNPGRIILNTEPLNVRTATVFMNSDGTVSYGLSNYWNVAAERNQMIEDDCDDLCWNCGGEGYVLNDCDEDTCCCLDPEESHGYSLCPFCGGEAA